MDLETCCPYCVSDDCTTPDECGAELDERVRSEDDPPEWWWDDFRRQQGVIQWFHSGDPRDVRNEPTHDGHGRCLHADVEPVVSVLGEVVAGICRKCDEQVPPPGGWT